MNVSSLPRWSRMKRLERQPRSKRMQQRLVALIISNQLPERSFAGGISWEFADRSSGIPKLLGVHVNYDILIYARPTLSVNIQILFK